MIITSGNNGWPNGQKTQVNKTEEYNDCNEICKLDQFLQTTLQIINKLYILYAHFFNDLNKPSIYTLLARYIQIFMSYKTCIIVIKVTWEIVFIDFLCNFIREMPKSDKSKWYAEFNHFIFITEVKLMSNHIIWVRIHLHGYSILTCMETCIFGWIIIRTYSYYRRGKDHSLGNTRQRSQLLSTAPVNWTKCSEKNSNQLLWIREV